VRRKLAFVALLVVVCGLSTGAHAWSDTGEGVRAPTATQTTSARGAYSDAVRPVSAIAEADPGAISFDELPLYTSVTDQYASRGVVFTSDVFTSPDTANPTAPVLSGTPKFFGDISARFTVPGTDQPTTVNGFSLDVGYIDDRDSVEIQYFDSAGGLAGSTRAQSYGINHIEVTYRGVASFTVRAVEYEAAGFAIDNLAVSSGNGIQPVRMAELGDSYSSGEGLLPEKGLHYDCGTDLHRGRYIEGTTQPVFISPRFTVWGKGSCQTETGSTKRPDDLGRRKTATYENLCHRNGRAYPNQIRERLGVLPSNSIFVACSGATTENVGAGTLTQVSYKDSPPGVHGGQTQLENVRDFAAGGAPDLLTIGIGGNDANFVGIVTECIFHTCTDSDFASRTVSTINGTMFHKVRETFEGLKKSFPDATIVAFGYPSVVDDPAQECARAFRIGSDELAWIKDTVLPTINDAIKDAAAEVGVAYADITAATAGHGICSSDSWINGVRWGNDKFAVIGDESFHPSQRAHDAIASYFVDHYTDGSGRLLISNPDPSPPIRPETGPEIRLGHVDVGPSRPCGAACLQPAACIQVCEVNVRGGGFDPGAVMGVTLESAPVSLGEVAADPTGNVDARFKLPRNLEPGLHSITIDGYATDGTREHAVEGLWVFKRLSPKIKAGFKVSGRRTQVRTLTVKRVPPGTRVDVACARGLEGVEKILAVGGGRGRGGCPFAHRRFRIRKPHRGRGEARPRRGGKGSGSAGSHGLYAGYFRRPLKPGTVVRVAVSHGGWAGRTVDFRIRAGKRPKAVRRCTEPGLRTPGRC